MFGYGFDHSRLFAQKGIGIANLCGAFALLPVGSFGSLNIFCGFACWKLCGSDPYQMNSAS